MIAVSPLIGWTPASDPQPFATRERRTLRLPHRLELSDERHALVVLPTGLLARWRDLDGAVVVSSSEREASTDSLRDSSVVGFFNLAKSADEVVHAVRDDPRVGLADGAYGVRPSLARRILETRDARGGFRSLAEIDAVRGVGPDTLHDIRSSLERRRWLSGQHIGRLVPRLIVRHGDEVVGSVPFVRGHWARIGGRYEIATLAWHLDVSAVRGDLSDASFVRVGWRVLGRGTGRFTHGLAARP